MMTSVTHGSHFLISPPPNETLNPVYDSFPDDEDGGNKEHGNHQEKKPFHQFTPHEHGAGPALQLRACP